MGLLEVTLVSTYVNQQCVNRWNYISGGTPAAVSTAFGLAFAFGAIYDQAAIPPAYPADTVIGHLRNLIVTGVSFQQLTVIDVYDPVNFYQTPFNPIHGGSVAGDGMPPFNAIGLRSNQVRRDIARGTKRFTGVPETSVGGGGGLTGPILAQINAALVASMNAILEYDDEGNTLTYSPCIVSKQEYDPNPTEPARNHRAYRYYPTLLEQLEHVAIGIQWEPYTTVRSQVSRQFGRGI